MPKKILLADDSVTIQKVIELTFSGGDYEVKSVSNGKLAIEQVEKDRPDIILCDIIMPELSGYDVAEYIKKNPKYSAIPVILLTGTFEPFDEERAKATGAETYVTKPFDSKDLIDKVESLLAQKVKVEGVEKVEPAVIFQEREEYQISGAITDEAIEKMKEKESPSIIEPFPQVEEIEKEKLEETGGIEADFIPSSDEIVAPDLPPSEVEETLISDSVLPSFENIESVIEPPSFGEDLGKAVTEPEEIKANYVEEEPIVSGEVAPLISEESKEESVTPTEEVLEKAQSPFEGPLEEFVEPEIASQQRGIEPPLSEQPIEIPEESVEQPEGEIIAQEEIKHPTTEEGIVDVGKEEEVEIPPFIPSQFEEAEVSENFQQPEIVTDLSEQVMMIKEEQEKLEEQKEVVEETQQKEGEISIEEGKKEFAEEMAEPSAPIEEPQEFPSEITEEKQLEEEVVKAQIEDEKQEQVSEETISQQNAIEEEEKLTTQEIKVEVTEEMVEKIVKKVVEEMAPSIIKDIAWEVIPELANTIIKKRIEELEKEVEE